MLDFCRGNFGLAAYVGIVPRVSQSNETDNRGGSTKRGAVKAIIATVRKLHVITYDTLKNG